VADSHLPQLPEEITFASELIKIRSERGLTQALLAQKSGLSLSAIKAYESGRNMPGARELRELCQALQISPNKLLFGTETPFAATTVANLLIDSDTEDQLVKRMRLAMLSSLLSSDERSSLYVLAESIAIARHGESKVRETLHVADGMAGLGRSLLQGTRDALVTKKPIDPDAIARQFEEFMDRQGHKPEPK
jgi:transcriptional regulator with XRE-family HTH domain